MLKLHPKAHVSAVHCIHTQAPWNSQHGGRLCPDITATTTPTSAGASIITRATTPLSSARTLIGSWPSTPGWLPRYVDYLALGFTTSTAFSPTDVMPMAPWAKLMMALQSLISLTVIGLVIARAVNVFT